MSTAPKSDTIKLYKSHTLPVYPRETGAVLWRGKGTEVWDKSSKRYLDFSCGVGVNNLGHCHPDLVEVGRDQLGMLWHTSNQFYNVWHGELAAKLSAATGLEMVFFTNSGAESNETAIKIARKWGSENGQRFEIICFKQAFHGRTLATLSATGNAKIQAGFEPLLPGFVTVPAFDFEAIKNAINDRTVAIMLEPIIGGAGVLLPPANFLADLRRLADQRNLLLILDEMQSGIGRTGRMFAFHEEKIQPDIVTIAKALAGGFPIGATICSAKVGEKMVSGGHGTTFGGNPIGTRIGCKVLEIVSSTLLMNNVDERGADIVEGLLGFQRGGKVKAVRQRGLMIGVTVDVPPRDLLRKLAENGVLCVPAGADSIRVYPPLNVSADEVQEFLGLFEKTLAEF